MKKQVLSDGFRKGTGKMKQAIRTKGKKVVEYFLHTPKKVIFRAVSGYVLSALALSAAVASVVYGLSLKPAYALSVDGETVGYVESNQPVLSALHSLESEMTARLGDSFRFDSEISYRFAAVSPEKLMDEEACLSLFQDLTDEVYAEACTLYIDGEKLAVAADSATAEAVLDRICEEQNRLYAAEGETIEIYNTVRMEDCLSLRSEILSESQLYYLLSGESETAMASLNRYLKTRSAFAPEGQTLLALSGGSVHSEPGNFTEDRYQPSDTAAYSEKGKLTFVTVSFQTFVETVPFETVYVESDSVYLGLEEVQTEGSDGLAERTYMTQTVDGRAISKECISETVLESVTDKVILVGTKEWKATGHFIWPLKGLITSYYGGRYIFDGYNAHTGIDVDGDTGDAFVAADGGTVLYAGDSGSTYGYLTVIDHGNGYVTYYAHQSKILVSEGDAVYQGQVIGLVGMTGRVTGSHLHFEVRYNGERVDPMKLLPSMYD